MKELKKISISLSPDVIKQLEDGKYNKSKLTDSLLTEHFSKEAKTQKRIILEVSISEYKEMVEGVRKKKK